jgi:signal transduction histidine kinase
MSDIVWAINPERDHLGDLTQRMRRFASDVFSARGIDFKFRLPVEEGELRLRANLRREVFLIYKEAVNNAVRHSGCTAAEIDLSVEGHRNLFLRLSDNGRGFDVTSKSTGHGLSSMRARTEALGGRLEITSEREAGTVLSFNIPLNPYDTGAPPGHDRRKQPA